ncbi:histidine kinase N-terminal 7TM domain-containing protein [Halomicrobium sp. LC1Hm]|uniref:histidine kinase N-terminal 7TM domain-containing protein n=1 Tax=Halomicrobium sp. LC1Hm TaxID=2610902 RepID=UPI0012985122|nr:histidine kinase N-terminal 7TM domain-containing protein [Halomicrobium sp. LC1Hm]QGA81642.1 Signal transduction histidine kinase, contains PAS domain [Halomicrobium sp. LC1Hm]
MSALLGFSMQAVYGVFFLVAALACLGSIARARTVDDRDTRHGLIGLLLTSGLWALTYLGIIYSPTTTLKEAWYTVGLVVGFGTVFAWLYFCSAYTDRTYHETRSTQLAGLGLYAFVVGIKLTNPIHGEYFTARIVQEPFTHLAIQHGTVHWLATGLAYVLAAVGLFMLFEAFANAGYDTRSLGGLTALTALPIALDLVAFESTALIDIIYAPLGVAAFAVGVLFVARDRFLAVQLTGNIPEPVVFLDEDDRIREYNDAAARLFPTLSGTRGQSVTAALPMDQDLSGQEIVVVEGEETRYFLVNASPLTSVQSNICRMLVFVDVTRLERQRQELERHNEQLEDFSAGIRHELLNSLQVVGGQVSAAGTALEAGNVGQARETLSTASRRAREMETVVDGLSTLARHGQTVDELEPIRLDDVVADARDAARPDGVAVDVPPATTIEADRTRLHELFVNIFQFLSHNGGTDARVAIRPDGFAVETDWVPPEELADDELFEYSGGLTDTKTGLTLPKVRTLVRVQGWEVALERTDEGSRIVVSGARVREDVPPSS